MKRLNMTFALAFFVALATTAGAAHAGEVDQQNLAAGEALHVEASRLLAENKLTEASKKFGEAFAKSQNPGSLLAQAVTERKLGHFAGALKLYRTYLALPANVKVTPEWKKKAETEAAKCEKNLCRLDVRADSFSVDGTAEVGVVFAEPGTHAVSMVGKGGEKLVSVKCAAGAVVVVPYENGGKVPDPPPGEKGETGSWVLPIALTVVGAIGLGFGAGFGVASGSSKDELQRLQAERRCGFDLAACEDVRSAGATQATVSVVGYVAGGVSLAGAVIAALVLTPWKERSPKKTAWLPLVSPNEIGAAYFVRF